MSKDLRQAVRENYDTATDLPSLARLIYVRALFKVFATAHGKNSSAKMIAYTVTADLLHEAVGYVFSIAEIRELVDESAEEAAASNAAAPAKR